MAKTREDFTRLVGQCEFPGLTYAVRYHANQPAHQSPDVPIYVLQVQGFDAMEGPWSGRKWLLSQHMTDSEVVQTVFMATLAALEHEAREKFTWHGRNIFCPHYHVADLWSLHGLAGRDVRDDNQSMQPE